MGAGSYMGLENLGNTCYMNAVLQCVTACGAGAQRVAAELGEPPILFGLDSVHGAGYVQGATVYPQQLNIGATFNRTAAFEFGRLASKDTRAAGVPWLFSPILGIATSDEERHSGPFPDFAGNDFAAPSNTGTDWSMTPVIPSALYERPLFMDARSPPVHAARISSVRAIG